jgi:hypothetical protein
VAGKAAKCQCGTRYGGAAERFPGWRGARRIAPDGGRRGRPAPLPTEEAMIDRVTGKPLMVERYPSPKAHPTIYLSADQLPTVKALLDAHQVPYWDISTHYSINDGPFMTKIELSYKADPEYVQQLLDSVP